ncbi:conserved Plasmodium protein, unknown function [Plasmodium ovale]|uniref:Uncharacterized protein n=1 Tax=Plasmodium ovale TaxID=36330 RepID=A0A1D3TG47_PLAOA|nr:conserved Plasmodium protein, unknown function [Plasmodium ovale]
MKKICIIKYVVLLCYILTSLDQISVRCAANGRATIDTLEDNVLLAFLLLVQLEVPYFLGSFSTKEKYDKVIGATIHLLNEEIRKGESVKEQRGYSIQDLNSIVQDLHISNEKYFTWLDLIYKECWYGLNNCQAVTSRNCSLPSLIMLPQKTIPITCTKCILYAINYALHSKHLFKILSNIEVCNEENISKFAKLSVDVSIIREYRVYLNSLDTISVLKNIQSEIIVLHIKNGEGLINLLKKEGHEAFIRVVRNSLSEVLKKSVKDYMRYLNYNNLDKQNGDNDITNWIMEKSINLTVNGYVYSDKETSELLRVQDFGLFLSEIYLKKCISLLTGNNLFLQIEIGNANMGNFRQSGNLLNFIEFELILNSYLHFGSNYYSKAVMLLKKVIYTNDKNGNNVFTYDEFNNDRYIVDRLLNATGGRRENGVSINGDLANRNKGGSLDIHKRNNLMNAPSDDNTERRKEIEEFKKNQLELMDDQTIFCIILVRILPETKHAVMKNTIINLLSKPVQSKSLDGFQYNDHKLIDSELVEILGESYNNPENNVKRRTHQFGSRVNKREIQSIEKLIQEGYKLVQIAFHNFSSIPLKNRIKFYSANKMFSLFEHRLHYLNEWNAQILFIRKIHPEDMIQKNYNVYAYKRGSKDYWFIICCTVIPLLVIILSCFFYKFMFHDKLKLSSLFKGRKTKRHKFSTHGTRSTRYKHYKYFCKLGKNSQMKKHHMDKEELRHLLRKKTKHSHTRKKEKNKDSKSEGSSKKRETRNNDFFQEEIQPNYEFV